MPVAVSDEDIKDLPLSSKRHFLKSLRRHNEIRYTRVIGRRQSRERRTIGIKSNIFGTTRSQSHLVTSAFAAHSPSLGALCSQTIIPMRRSSSNPSTNDAQRPKGEDTRPTHPAGPRTGFQLPNASQRSWSVAEADRSRGIRSDFVGGC